MKKLIVLIVLAMLFVGACEPTKTPTPEIIIETVIMETIVTATPESFSFTVTFKNTDQAKARGTTGEIRKMVPAEIPYGVWEVDCKVLIIDADQFERHHRYFWRLPDIGDFTRDTLSQSTFTMTGYEGAVVIMLMEYDIDVIYPFTCTFKFLGVD